jgi:hypothetical protein
VSIARDASTPTQKVIERLQERGCQHGSGQDWQCPHHDDQTASLGVTQADDGRALLKCQAGCATEDVVKALGLSMADLFPANPNGTASFVAATYDYTDENGVFLFQVIREEPKAFRQRRKSVGKWVWNLGDVRRVLYRLPNVVAAVKDGKTIYLVEGEKDVHSLEAVGEVATCNPMGAGAWKDDYTQPLQGAQVVIVRDRDPAGRAHAATAAASLQGIAASVAVVEACSGKDASDHLAAGYGLDRFVVVDANDAPSTTTTPSVDDPDVADAVRRIKVAERAHAIVRAEREPPPTGRLMGIEEFLNAPAPEHDELIPNALCRTERVGMTGYEGNGKTTFLRQVAAQTAVGVHPLTLAAMPPIRSMLVDLENPQEDAKAKLRAIRDAAIRAVGADAWHEAVKDGRFTIVSQESGIDLSTPTDRRWLTDHIEDARPDLLLAGPAYKMHRATGNWETDAQGITTVLDELRATYALGMILELHCPQESPGHARPKRPIGAALWMRWLEYGLFLSHDGLLERWRRDRTERGWPQALKRGDATRAELWPWMPVLDDEEQQFLLVLNKAKEWVETQTVKVVPSYRKLEDLTGISKSHVGNLVTHPRFQAQWAAFRTGAEQG